MKNYLYIVFLLISTFSYGQEVTVSGKIFDVNGEALIGATVMETGTDNVTVSDFNGSYELRVAANASLTVSYTGYETKETALNNATQLNITLEESAEKLDEVVVSGFMGVIGKARKRTASTQKIAESITAFNSDGIEKVGINNVTSFANHVPNLKLSESQAIGVNSLVVRGIPQIRNTDAPVAFVIDGVTIADPSLLNQELFDLALIEVVKGPQGALYGKNAIGGAINIYTKEPTNNMKNKVTLGYGNGNAYQGSFVSSGAIKKDKVYYRLSSQYKNFDGLLTNDFLNEKVDVKKEFTGRGQLMFTPTADFKANVTLQYINSSGGATYYSIAPESVDNDGWLEYLSPTPTDGNNLISQEVLGESTMKNLYSNVNLEYKFDKVKIQSITSYSDVDRRMTGDLDFTEVFVLDQGEFNNTTSFNQEFRLSNINSNSKFDWSVGGFYQTLEREFFQSDLFFSDEWAVTDYVATFNTLALFGFVDYDITDKLTASAGLRFDSDNFKLDDLLNVQEDTKTANVPQPKVSLSYQATNDVLLYANYGRGYRAGGYNPVVTDLFNRDFDGETSDNYEFGFKTAWWNNRFILNGSAFYSDFTNRQQFIITEDDCNYSGALIY
jgi:iron complex outermembrane receptor protein